MSETRPRNLILPDNTGLFLRGRDYSIGFQSEQIIQRSSYQPVSMGAVMANEAAKIKFIHRKAVERYLEGPTAADEDLIKIMDLGNTNAQPIYQELGQVEHPLYIRDEWVSQAAARITDEGYWTWVNTKIRSDQKYRVTMSGIAESSPVEPWGDSPWGEAPFLTNEAQPANIFTTPPQAITAPPPPPPRPRQTRADRDEEHRRALEDLLGSPAILAPTRVEL